MTNTTKKFLCAELNNHPRNVFTYISVGNIMISDKMVPYRQLLCIDGGDFVTFVNCETEDFVDLVITSSSEVIFKGNTIGYVKMRGSRLMFEPTTAYLSPELVSVLLPLDLGVDTSRDMEAYLHGEETLFKTHMSLFIL